MKFTELGDILKKSPSLRTFPPYFQSETPLATIILTSKSENDVNDEIVFDALTKKFAPYIGNVPSKEDEKNEILEDNKH